MSGLRESVLASLRWVAGARLFSQVFTWAITIYVIRILSPGDYGLMGIATIFIAFLRMLNELGLGAALVQKEQMTLRMQRQIFGLVLVVNVGISLLLYTTAPAIASFYEETRLTPIIRLLSTQFFIMSFLVVPKSQLERNIDLKRVSIVDFVAAALSSVLTLVLALNGFGVWSLVWGTMVTVIVRTVGMNFASPFSPHAAFFASRRRSTVRLRRIRDDLPGVVVFLLAGRCDDCR